MGKHEVSPASRNLHSYLHTGRNCTEYLMIPRTREKKRDETSLGLPLLNRSTSSTLLLPQLVFLAPESQVA